MKAGKPHKKPHKKPHRKPNRKPDNSRGKKDDDKKNEDRKLSFETLADGVYAVSGTMLKADRRSASMANNGISHTIQLTVKSGKYSLTMAFRGMKVGDQLGYLGALNYYKSGYRISGNNAPYGATAVATVNSYQTDKSGGKLKDGFGTNYLRSATVPLIPEAKKDGYVPLQVFVPIMDSLSKGSGTQSVYLKLDKRSVRRSSTSEISQKNRQDTLTPGSTDTKEDVGGSGSSLSNAGLPNGLSKNTLQKTVGKQKNTIKSSEKSQEHSEEGNISESTKEGSAKKAMPGRTEKQEPPLRKYVVPSGIAAGLIVTVSVLHKIVRNSWRRKGR